MENITADIAEAFDEIRSELGPAGNLQLLDKRDDDDPQAVTDPYRLIGTITAGWLPKRTTRFEAGGVVDVIKIKIAESADLLNMSDFKDTTFVAWGGFIRSVKNLYEPISEPRIWILFVAPTGEAR